MIRILAILAFVLTLAAYKPASKNFDTGPYVTKDTVINGMNVRIRYVPGLDSTEGVATMNGSGEIGTDTGRMDTYGPWWWFYRSAWTGEVELGNGTHYPTYIYIQPVNIWHNPTQVANTLKLTLATKYCSNIKKESLHVIGYSMGGWEFDLISTYKSNSSDLSFIKTIKSIVNIRGASTSSNTYGSMLPHPQRHGNWAKIKNGRYLGIEQIADSRSIYAKVANVNDSLPGAGYFIWSAFAPSGGHGDGMDSAFSPYVTNWTSSNTSLRTTKSGSGINSIFLPANTTLYQFMLRSGDTTLYDIPDDQVFISSNDTVRVWSHSSGYNGSFTVRAAVVQGTPTTWTWSVASGPNTPTLTNTTSQNATFADYVPGYYSLRVIGSDGVTSDTVYKTVWIRNLMEKNVKPCRSGPGLKFRIGDVISGSQVSSTSIYIPYLERDGFLGQPILGGDTIVIARNKNNNGVWNAVELGDFGGGPGCPVTVCTDSILTINGFDIAARDSNVVVYAHFNGLANRLTKDIVYGFQFDKQSQSVNDSNSIAMTANLVHHFEVDGFSVRNAGVGILLKKNSDSSKPFTIFNNFRHTNVKIHDIYGYRINGEFTYIGHTDIGGKSQVGSDPLHPTNWGPTVQGDSLRLYRAIVDSVKWDGFQVSNFGYNALLYDLVAYRTGRRNQSSQQWSVLAGGNTQAEIFNSVMVDGTGPMGTLGKGKCKIYNNYIAHNDNGKTGGSADVEGIYISQSVSGMSDPGLPQPIDSLSSFLDSNVIEDVTRYSIYTANANGYMKPGAMRNNKYIGTPSKPFTTNASDTLSNNQLLSGYDVDAHFANHEAYQVYKIVRDNPGQLVSFFELEETTPPVEPTNRNYIITRKKFK